jgi:outer membrane protein assembly factor BamB
MNIKIKTGICLLSCLALTSCGTLWEKDNTPAPANLAQFTPVIKPHQLWNNRIAFEPSHERLKLNPVITAHYLLVTDSRGTITIVNKDTGRTYWKPALNKMVTAGIAANDNLAVIGTKGGHVIALNLSTKEEIWQADVGNEILAAPIIHNDIVFIKTIDGRLIALSSEDGHQRWSYFELEPNLILRGSSVPQVAQGAVVIGYASGKLVKLSLNTGQVLWSQNIAVPQGSFAIQRMIDIDANPIIVGNHVFAATYQGKIAALNFGDGSIIWDHDISTFTGMAVDSTRVYVSDADSTIWAFEKATGKVIWKQAALAYRNITSPAIQGSFIIVADAGGALHWLNKQNGDFAGRVQLGGSIVADPITQGEIVYVLTQNGYLVAYTV